MMLRHALLAASVLASCSTGGAASFPRVAGYQPVSDISAALAVGPAIEKVAEALGAEPRNWTAAQDAYLGSLTGGLSLRSILLPLTRGRELLNVSIRYHGSADFVHEFVQLALSGTGKFDLSEKMRQELAMKGIVLQGVLLASITALQGSLASCLAGQTDDSSGAPHDIDTAWGLYACSQSVGPIKLAEKRAPQFDVEAAAPTEAGASRVNARLLELFSQMQAEAQQGNCATMGGLVSQSISQMQVPVIQGMLREAYEVDPKESDEHHGADGFVEVAEGWAFARAVLPAIAECSTQAAAIIVRNMDTLSLGEAGPHVPDGYEEVKRAVESTYACLGISCQDVNAMISPWTTGQTLWEPCDDARLPSLSTTGAPAAEQEVSTAVHHARSVAIALVPLALLW